MRILSPFELLAEELGVVAGRIERESSLRFSALMADIERKFAERELHIERLQKVVDILMAENFQRWDKMVSDRLNSLRDGKDGIDGKDGKDGINGTNGQDGTSGKDGQNGIDGKDGKDGIDGKDGAEGKQGPEGAAGPQGLPGLPGIPGERGEVGPVGAQGKDGIDGACGPTGPTGEAGPAGPQGEKGETGAQGLTGLNGTNGERGPEGKPGKLPKVKRWTAVVHYDGDVCTHKGSLYQAKCDTGQEPTAESDHWICLASAGVAGKDGRDGADGKSLTIRETFDPKGTYKELDVVTLDHKWFVAKQDNPGMCPGPGWKAGPGIGKTGRPGERGVKGEQGPKGETAKAFEIARWDVDAKRYEATPVMTDGSRGPTIQLRELFAQYQEEVG